MKKIAIVLIMVTILSLCACNMSTYDWFDTNYGYTKAYINVCGEWSLVNIRQWTYSNVEGAFALILSDGTALVVHSVNCILFDGNL